MEPFTDRSLLGAAGMTKLKQNSDLDLKEARIYFDLKDTQRLQLIKSINDNSKLVD